MHPIIAEMLIATNRQELDRRMRRSERSGLSRRPRRSLRGRHSS